MRVRRWVTVLSVLVAVLLCTAPVSTGIPSPGWDSWNAGLAGARYAAGEQRITPRTSAHLKLKW